MALSNLGSNRTFWDTSASKIITENYFSTKQIENMRHHNACDGSPHRRWCGFIYNIAQFFYFPPFFLFHFYFLFCVYFIYLFYFILSYFIYLVCHALQNVFDVLTTLSERHFLKWTCSTIYGENFCNDPQDKRRNCDVRLAPFLNDVNVVNNERQIVQRMHKWPVAQIRLLNLGRVTSILWFLTACWIRVCGYIGSVFAY